MAAGHMAGRMSGANVAAPIALPGSYDDVTLPYEPTPRAMLRRRKKHLAAAGHSIRGGRGLSPCVRAVPWLAPVITLHSRLRTPLSDGWERPIANDKLLKP